MSEVAQLALQGVRVGGQAADLYVYDDRLVITSGDGERTIPMGRVERVATRRTWGRGARLLLTLPDGEIVEVRRLTPSATVTAHRTIVAIARRLH
jgi:hypothetical protein